LELGRDLRTLGAAAILAEAVLLTSGEEPDPDLYALILGALEALEREEGEHAPRILLPAGWALMEHLGFSPVLDRCAHCGSPLTGEEILTFHVALGGVVCGSCHGGPGAGRGGPRLGPSARGQLARMVTGEAQEELRGEVPHLKLLRNFMEFHLGARRPMASFDFLLDQLA
jgi:recombinational DNA repair protein (RecF pathway)